MIRLPTRFIPIGGTVKRGDIRLVVVERPAAESLQPFQACEGCYFAACCVNRLQCSSFDREDGRNVWFVEDKGR